MTANPTRYVNVPLTPEQMAELMRIGNETGLSVARLVQSMLAGSIRDYGPKEE